MDLPATCFPRKIVTTEVLPPRARLRKVSLPATCLRWSGVTTEDCPRTRLIKVSLPATCYRWVHKSGDGRNQNSSRLRNSFPIQGLSAYQSLAKRIIKMQTCCENHPLLSNLLWCLRHPPLASLSLKLFIRSLLDRSQMWHVFDKGGGHVLEALGLAATCFV